MTRSRRVAKSHSLRIRLHGENLPSCLVHAHHALVVETKGCSVRGASDHFETQSAVLLVGVERAPVGSEVYFGLEGGGKAFSGLDGACGTIKMGVC